MGGTTGYEADFYAWTNEQAALLRAGRLVTADVENIAGELESLGKSQRRELISRLTVLLTHLLKWQFQPDRRSGSWKATIITQRAELADHLHDNPSLAAQLSELLTAAYRRSLRAAAAETELPETVFPLTGPWTPAQVMDDDFWPGD